MKQSDSISRLELVNERFWSDELIPLYLGDCLFFKKSIVIKIERYLTKLGIKWKT